MKSEAGYSLLGELVALALVGATLVILLNGLGLSSRGVMVVERRVSGENYARQQVELIKSSAYQPDPTSVPYPTVTASGVYSLSVAVSYWSPDSETFQDTLPEIDSGLQRVTVSVFTQANPTAPVFTLESYKGVSP
jgi:type II secretory pathway pseudopilin PulG